MDQFLETYNLLRLNGEEIRNLNRLIMSKDIKSVIKNLSTQNNFSGKFYQIPKEESIPILLKRFQQIEEQGPLSKIFLFLSFLMRPALP